MRPKLSSEVLRNASPRKMYGSSLIPPNRYNVLSRDSSPANSVRSENSQRSRSHSIKRKNSSDATIDSGISYSDAVSGATQAVPLPCNLDEDIAKIRSVCDLVSTEISKAEIDPVLITIFGYITEAVLGVVSVQAKIADGKTWKPIVVHPLAAAASKKPRPDDGLTFTNLATLREKSQTQVTPPAVNPQVTKFIDTVKEAEKSTLIFNLNMGTVPLMNRDTMSTKATMALTEMAAKVENAKGKIPSADTRTALDDVLSVATGMQFYGRKTKSFSRKNDPDSGAYCTIPIRYDFENKEDRIEAETVLRDKCKIQCSTPYPTILRAAIKQVLDRVKKDNPNHYVRVAVDTGNMLLKIAKRPMLDLGKNSNQKKVWSNVGTVRIPEEALDVHARQAPENFTVGDIQYANPAHSGSGSEMELDVTLTAQLSTSSQSTPNTGTPTKKTNVSPSRARRNLSSQ
jgi:hypothetical protein